MEATKISLVTGANTGIGKYTALALAARGDRVLLVCRNAEKGEKARQELMVRSKNPNIELHCCDLSSMAQVRELASALLGTMPQLDVLVNNAAIFYTDFALTPEGHERQWAVNHLAPFLLTDLLLPLMMRAPAARIVNVSSKGNYKGEIHFDDLNLSRNYSGLRAYRQSKLANVLFTYELARRLAGTGITANTLHPGVVGTQIGYANNRKLPALVWTVGSVFMLNPEEGAATSVYLATSAEVAGVSGKYFDKCKPKRSAAASYDEALAAKLWETTKALLLQEIEKTA